MKISVCIATYNGHRHIAEQIGSILKILPDDSEIIISDDLSTDNTINIINEFKDDRIKIFQNTSKGVNRNFNNCLEHSKGDIIFLCDQDDVWMSNKISLCILALKTSSCVMHNAILTDESLNDSGHTLFEKIKNSNGVVSNIIRNRFTGCCMAFRRELLDKIIPIPDTKYFFHDQWIGMICMIYGSVAYIEEPCMLFRRHNYTTSSVLKRSNRPILTKIVSRTSLIKNLFLRAISRK